MSEATGERWWICTDMLIRGGVKVLGPFESKQLALDVRFYVEQCNKPNTYWVDAESASKRRRVASRGSGS